MFADGKVGKLAEMAQSRGIVAAAEMLLLFGRSGEDADGRQAGPRGRMASEKYRFQIMSGSRDPSSQCGGTIEYLRR